jgi:hypothetical protein
MEGAKQPLSDWSLFLDNFKKFFILICRCANCFEKRIQFLVWCILIGVEDVNFTAHAFSSSVAITLN